MEEQIKKQTGIVMTPEDIQAIVAAAVTAAVTESKKPTPLTEQQIRDIESKNQERAANAEMQKQMKANKEAFQKVCTHQHKRGDSHCVFVENGNFIICQACQLVVRPEDDINLFNRLFQACTTAAFG